MTQKNPEQEQIRLPADSMAAVKKRVESGEFKSAQHYIAALVDQAEKASEQPARKASDQHEFQMSDQIGESLDRMDAADAIRRRK